MKSKTLFEIGADIQALYDILTEADGEVSDESAEEVIEEWFKELEKNQSDKFNGYCRLIANLEYLYKARESEAKRLSDSSRTIKNKAKRLEKRLLDYMTINNIDKVTTDLYTISASNNGGKLPLIYPELWKTSPEEAPEEYHKTVIDLNLETLRYDLESGADVKDCAIAERGKHLRIK